MLRLEHLERTYGGVGGVTDASVHVPAGAIYVLCGRNGAGKTTALSVVTGRLFSQRGSLAVGEPAQTIPLDRPAARPGLGYVSDQPALDPALTPWQWLAFAAAVKGAPRDTAAERDLADVLLMDEELLHTPIRSLSFGNRRKAALWTELATTRGTLVLDEPLIGLDPPSIEGFHAAARAFVRTGRSILMSTHHLREAEALATHAGILHDGRTLREGPLAEFRGAGSLHEAYMEAVGR